MTEKLLALLSSFSIKQCFFFFLITNFGIFTVTLKS